MSQADQPQAATAARDQDSGGSGDDELENREQIEKTGEPKTDKLGNADGAS